MATFERTGPLLLEPQLDGSATEGVDCGVAACVMALDDASYGLVRPSTEAIRKRDGQRPRCHEPRPVEGRHRLVRRPLHSRSASSHPRPASCAARATTSSGDSSTTSAAASSPPSTTARSRVRGGRSGRAAPSAATMPSTSAPPLSSTRSAGSRRTTPSPTGASRAARTVAASGPSGSCAPRPATSATPKGRRIYPDRGPLDRPRRLEGPAHRRTRRRRRSR